MNINLTERFIDHGYYQLTGREATALALEVKRKVPHYGWELRVDVNGGPAWLTRTWRMGKLVWAVYGRDIIVKHVSGEGNV